MTYSTGFLFDETRQYVLLIEKLKPEWQRNRLNGVGGKIEPNETPDAAMVREFQEETGLVIPAWQHFLTLTGNDSSYRSSELSAGRFSLYFYRAFASIERLKSAESITPEQVQIVEVKRLHCHPTIPNIKWLVPMALSMDFDRAKSFEMSEVMH